MHRRNSETEGVNTRWAVAAGPHERSVLARRGAAGLPNIPAADWRIPASEIEICKNADGADAVLGAGAFGKVGMRP